MANTKRLSEYTPQELGSLTKEQMIALIASERAAQETETQFSKHGIALSGNGLLMVRVDDGMPKEHKRYGIVLEREYWEQLLAKAEFIKAALGALPVVTIADNKARKAGEAEKVA